jgi:hypothetical protein
VAFPITNMVGFAVGLAQSPVGELADPAALHQAFQKAHQVLFTSAFHALSSPLPENSLRGVRDGLIQDVPTAIILVRPISLAVEVAIGIITALTLALWCFSNRRRSNLCTDPASIKDIMSLMAPCSSDSHCEFRDDGKLSADALAGRLLDSTFYLKSGSNGNQIIRQTLANVRFAKPEIQEHAAANRPAELHLALGSVFFLLLSGSIAGLAFLQIKVWRQNGIYHFECCMSMLTRSQALSFPQEVRSCFQSLKITSPPALQHFLSQLG